MSHDPRPVPTRVKHEILQQYLETWGGIISHGLLNRYQQHIQRGSSQNFSSNFVYVDCFSFTGKYGDEIQSTRYGSPVIGIRELDKIQEYMLKNYGFHITINVILSEKKEKEFKTLLDTLTGCGYQNRVITNPNLNSLTDRAIAVFKGDYRTHLNEILKFTSRPYTWSLFFLDPYGFQGIDLSSISRIVKMQYTDAIIYYPYLPIQQKTGSVIADNPNHPHYRHLKYIDQMYGTPEWRKQTMADIENKIDPMPDLVNLYRKTLEGLDEELAVKRIPLYFSDRDRELYNLFLTTHDGTGALKMNEILDGASIRQFDYRQEHRLMKTHPYQKSMFSVGEMVRDHPERPGPPEVDIDALANELHKRFRGKQMTYRDLLKHMCNEPYYVEDVSQAVKKLKQNKKVSHSGTLRHSTQLIFTS